MKFKNETLIFLSAIFAAADMAIEHDEENDIVIVGTKSEVNDSVVAEYSIELDADQFVAEVWYEIPATRWEPADYDFKEIGRFTYPAGAAKCILLHRREARIGNLIDSISEEFRDRRDEHRDNKCDYCGGRLNHRDLCRAANHLFCTFGCKKQFLSKIKAAIGSPAY